MPYKFTRFEAVSDPRFPLGVKVVYRAYSSDMVIEFTIKDKKDCSTPMGKMTSLDPVTRVCKWQPAIGEIEGRDVEGEYYLTSLPSGDFTFSALNNNGIRDYTKLRNALPKIAGKVNVEEWDEWFAEFAPNPDQIADYVNKIGLHVPLRNIMTTLEIRSPQWDCYSIEPEPPTDFGFEWPERYIISNASVRSHLNPHPPEPVSNLITDELVFVERYERELGNYYEKILNSSTYIMPKLKEIRSRRLDPSGKQKPQITTKDAICRAICVEDKRLIAMRYKKLTQSQKLKITALLNGNGYHFEVAVSHPENVSPGEEVKIKVTKDQLSDMLPDKVLRKGIMEQYCNLFNYHDEKLCASHHLQHFKTKHYSKRKRSLFIVDNMLNESNPRAIDNSIFDMYYVFVAIHREYDNWSLLILDITHTSMIYFDPHFDYLLEQDHRLLAHLQTIAMLWLKNAATSVENRNLVMDKIWEIQQYPVPNAKFKNYNITTYEPLENSDNSVEAGIYVIHAMDMLYRDTPLNIKQSDVNLLRERYIHCLIEGNLLH